MQELFVELYKRSGYVCNSEFGQGIRPVYDRECRKMSIFSSAKYIFDCPSFDVVGLEISEYTFWTYSTRING